MSSQVVGAALGGAPADRPSSEDNGRQQQQNKKDSEPVVTTTGKDPRPTNTARRTGGGQAPSKTQTGNNECQFFFEDEVFRIDRRGRVHFGVITETAESYSSDEEEEVDEVLAKGEVRVAFYPDGKEVVHTEQAIGLADRTLMPGDVVRRCLPGQKNLIGQAGYVRDVNVRADVKVLGSKYVIKNVPAERLRPISEWTRDVPVCLGTWIGTTVNVDECAVLKSVNGGRIEITSNDFHKFKDAVSPCAREVFNPNVYYPGNVVVGRLPPQDRIKNLTPDISLPTNRKSRAVYTVESIRTTSVNVAWTCRAISQTDNGTDTDPLKHPNTNIKGEDLDGVKRLNIYESYMLQIHDRFYLKYSKCDTLVKHADWEEEQAEKYLTIFQRQRLESMVAKDPPGNSPAPSSSGNARKFRRLVSKPSVTKLPRPISDKHLSQSASKIQSGDNEEAWESGDDEEDEETVAETLEPAESPEKLAGGADVVESADGTPQAPKNATRYIKPRRHIKKKIRSVKKLIGSPFSKKELDPKDGDEIVVETLVVYSSVTVVWQDGSVEAGIHSTQLYPIHHLDNHEFFPGDFVNKANENSTGATDYGVIQCVDHDERIAKVKWFNIYSKADNPVPTCRESEELSVYDLKDHSDYQYRPGTMVIRVSNFTGEDINSTAGQVIDNFPDGRVRVWWAKGHITMCYPQDLFEINHTDQEHDGYDTDQSGDSWETQSENSQVNMSLSSLDGEEHILKGVDLAKEAVERLEKSYRVLPCIRKPEVLLDLVSVYKNCVFLDSMFNTNFFHEEHFQGIVRRKRSKKGSPCHDCGICGEAARATTPEAAAKILADVAAAIAGHSSQTPTKRKSSTEGDEVQCKKTTATTVNEDSEEEEDEEDEDSMCELKLTESESKLSREELIDKLHIEFTEMFKEAQDSIHKAFEIHMKSDSGIVHSRQENAGEETNEFRNKSLKEIHVELMAKPNVDVCEVFCFLMKEQMAKCRKLIIETYKQAKSEKNDEEEVSEAEEATEDDDPAQADNEAMEQPLNLNGLSESLPPIPGPMACSSPSAMPESLDTSTPLLFESCFQVLPNAPAAHHFIGTSITPANKSQYQRAVHREYRMLQASLPPGVIVRAYEDRMDLMSVMMVGPKRTPYQNALFFFDFQMGREYPKHPPVCHYISYCTERLNPNLYEEGKVCVSLLGTWSGRDTEVWSPTSTMLQVLVSIQGLILVDEPYYNEAGYEKQRGTQLGNENSRVYNEMAIIKIAHSTVKQLKNPPLIFRQELIDHFKEFGGELHGRMQAWSEYSLEAQRRRIACIKDMPEDYKAPCDMPEFPLLPCSRGFCIAVKGVLAQLQTELTALEASSPEGKEERSGIEASTGTGTAPRAAPEEV